jgi:medium-chain acyl-[acyl-carrier-protein] hydrolase
MSGSQARLRLFCRPYAGGASGIFRDWEAKLPDAIDVRAIELPGRGARFAEPPILELADLVSGLKDGLAGWLDRPFALFGHSLGALVGYELARTFQGEEANRFVHLFVSGHRAPHLPDPHPALHQLADPELIEELRQLNGTPEELLDNPDWARLFLPIIRADLTAGETYRYVAADPLQVPISAFGGIHDPEVAPEEVNEWVIHTSAECQIRHYDGDHFFLNPFRDELLAAIVGDLEQSAGL